MELVFDSRVEQTFEQTVEQTVSNWNRNNEYSCSEEMCVCREAEVVQSVGWGLHYLPVSDALVTAAQSQLHIRNTTLAMPNCSCVRSLIPLSDIFTVQGAICQITEFRGNKPVRVGGFFGSLWNTLQARLNFT